MNFSILYLEDRFHRALKNILQAVNHNVWEELWKDGRFCLAKLVTNLVRPNTGPHDTITVYPPCLISRKLIIIAEKCRPKYRIFRFEKEKAGKELSFSVTYVTKFPVRVVSLHIILRKFFHIRGDFKLELGKLSLSWE